MAEPTRGPGGATAVENPPLTNAAPMTAHHAPGGAGECPSAELLADLKRLADRVGGMKQLRDLVDSVAGATH